MHDGIWQGVDIDPRLHFILNCASRSCPVLSTRVRPPDTLQTDLEETPAPLPRRRPRCRPRRPSPNSFVNFYFADFDLVGGIDVFIGQYRDVAGVNFSDIIPYDWS